MKIAIIVIVLLAVIGLGGYMATPRGIRNKNPLNIRYSRANDWVGQIGTDGAFSRFSEAKYGIRAGAKLLGNYLRSGTHTTAAVIARWAPSHENPTNDYVQYVARQIGKAPDERLTPADIPGMVKAMIRFENGINPYSDALILEGCKLAGVV